MQNILMNLAFYLRLLLPAPAFPCNRRPTTIFRAELLSPWWAGFISYVGGSRHAGHGAGLSRPRLSWDMLSRTSPFSWTGGILGRFTLPRPFS